MNNEQIEKPEVNNEVLDAARILQNAHVIINDYKITPKKPKPVYPCYFPLYQDNEQPLAQEPNTEWDLVPSSTKPVQLRVLRKHLFFSTNEGNSQKSRSEENGMTPS